MGLRLFLPEICLIWGWMSVRVPETLRELYASLWDRKKAMSFCFEQGIYKTPADCERCHARMALIIDREKSDGCVWRCTFCRCKRSIRKGSFMRGAKLEPQIMLALALMWCQDWDEASVARELGVDPARISLRFSLFADACLHYQNLMEKIGGEGFTVEIDETQLSRKEKEGGRAIAGTDVWILGGICRESGDIFCEPVADRTRETLVEAILRNVRFGTTIVTDSWAAYNDLEIWSCGGYRHEVVNHHRFFVDPITGVNTQKIERFWRTLKQKKKQMQGIAKHRAASYCAEFVVKWGWRRGNKPQFAACLDFLKGIEWI